MSAHCSLIGGNLTSLTSPSVPPILRSKTLTSLNLHANKLESLSCPADFIQSNTTNSPSTSTITVKTSDGDERLVPYYQSLTDLDISSNNLNLNRQTQTQSLNTTFLQLTPHLISLNLSANNLQTLTSLCTPFPKTQISLPSLKVLNLSYNSLNSLKNLKKSTPNISTLHLQGNLLSTPASLQPLSNLGSIRVLTLMLGDKSSSNPVCGGMKGYLGFIMGVCNGLLEVLDEVECSEGEGAGFGFDVDEDEDEHDYCGGEDVEEIDEKQMEESPSLSPRFDALADKFRQKKDKDDLDRIESLEANLKILTDLADKKKEEDAIIPPIPVPEEATFTSTSTNTDTDTTNQNQNQTTPRETQTLLIPSTSSSTQTEVTITKPSPPNQKQTSSLLLLSLYKSTTNNHAMRNLSNSFRIWMKFNQTQHIIEACNIARRSGAANAASALESRVHMTAESVRAESKIRIEELEECVKDLKVRGLTLDNNNTVLSNSEKALIERVETLEKEAVELNWRVKESDDKAIESERRRVMSEDERRRMESDLINLARECERSDTRRKDCEIILEKNKRDLEDVIEKGRNERVKNEAVVKQLKSTNNDKDATIKAKKSIIDGLSSEIKTLQDKTTIKINHLKQAFEDTAKRAAGDKAKCTKMEEIGRETFKLVTDQRGEIKSLKERIAAFSNNEEGRNDDVVKSKAYVTSLEGFIEEIKTKQTNLSLSLKLKDDTITEQSNSIQKLTSINTNIKHDMFKLKTDLDRIRNERNEVENELDLKHDLTIELQSEIMQLKNTLIESKCKDDDGDEDKKYTLYQTTKISDLEAEILELKRTQQEKDEALRYVEQELTSLKDAYEDKEGAMRQEFKSDMERFRIKIDEERDSGKSELKKMKVILKKVDKARAEEGHKKDGYKLQITQLKSTLSSISSENSSLSNEVDRIKSAMERERGRVKDVVSLKVYKEIVAGG